MQDEIKVWIEKFTIRRGGKVYKYYRVRWYDPSTGKRKTESYTQKKAAEYRRNVIYHELNRHLLQFIPFAHRLSWAELTEKYLNAKRVDGLAESTLATYRNTLRKFEEIIGTPDSDKISMALLRRFRETLVDAATELEGKHGGSLNSVNQNIRNINAFTSWAAAPEQGYMPSGLTLKQVKTAETVYKPLPEDKLARLLTVCRIHEPDYWLRIVLGLATGLRPIDIHNILIENIDLNNGTMYVVDKKTGKGCQNQPLPAFAVEAIKEHLCGRTSGPLFTKVFRQKRWIKLNDLAKIKPHWNLKYCRHQAVSMMAAAGVNESVYSKLLRHSSVLLTRNVYHGMELNTVKAAVETVGTTLAKLSAESPAA
jgi:integrase